MTIDTKALNNMPAPEWATRPWGRPTVHMTVSDLNPRLVGTAQFKYHGLRIQGVRVYMNDDGTLSVTMPQKRFGDTIESVLYFHDALEREQFERDVAWLWQAIFGRAHAARKNKQGA